MELFLTRVHGYDNPRLYFKDQDANNWYIRLGANFNEDWHVVYWITDAAIFNKRQADMFSILGNKQPPRVMVPYEVSSMLNLEMANVLDVQTGSPIPPHSSQLYMVKARPMGKEFVVTNCLYYGIDVLYFPNATYFIKFLIWASLKRRGVADAGLFLHSWIRTASAWRPFATLVTQASLGVEDRRAVHLENIDWFIGLATAKPRPTLLCAFFDIEAGMVEYEEDQPRVLSAGLANRDIYCIGVHLGHMNGAGSVEIKKRVSLVNLRGRPKLPDADSTVVFAKSTADLLDKFFSLVFNCFFIVGHNINGYDNIELLEALYFCHKELAAWWTLYRRRAVKKRAVGQWHLDQMGGMEYSVSISLPHQCNFDTMVYFGKYAGMKQLSLTQVAMTLIGEKKCRIDMNSMWRGFIKFYSTGIVTPIIQETISYCQQDVALLRISHNVINDYMLTATACHISIDEVINSKSQLPFLPYKCWFGALEGGSPIPNRFATAGWGSLMMQSALDKTRERTEFYDGGYVFPPQVDGASRIRNVTTIDVASLYPTQITTVQAGDGTCIVLPKKSFASYFSDEYMAKILPHVFINEEKGYIYMSLKCPDILGFIPRVMLSALDQRREAKREMGKAAKGSAEWSVLNSKQNAFKLLANGMYGKLCEVKPSYAVEYLINLDAGATTTFWGRHAIQTAGEICMKILNVSVIYGDTDSLFINTDDPEIAETVQTLLRETRGRAEFKAGQLRITKDQWGLYNPPTGHYRVVFENEGCFKLFIISKKKRYMGYGPKCGFKFRGLENCVGATRRVLQDIVQGLHGMLLGATDGFLEIVRRSIEPYLERQSLYENVVSRNVASLDSYAVVRKDYRVLSGQMDLTIKQKIEYVHLYCLGRASTTQALKYGQLALVPQDSYSAGVIFPSHLINNLQTLLLDIPEYQDGYLLSCFRTYANNIYQACISALEARCVELGYQFATVDDSQISLWASYVLVELGLSFNDVGRTRGIVTELECEVVGERFRVQGAAPHSRYNSLMRTLEPVALFPFSWIRDLDVKSVALHFSLSSSQDYATFFRHLHLLQYRQEMPKIGLVERADKIVLVMPLARAPRLGLEFELEYRQTVDEEGENVAHYSSQFQLNDDCISMALVYKEDNVVYRFKQQFQIKIFCFVETVSIFNIQLSCALESPWWDPEEFVALVPDWRVRRMLHDVYSVYDLGGGETILSNKFLSFRFKTEYEQDLEDVIGVSFLRFRRSWDIIRAAEQTPKTIMFPPGFDILPGEAIWKSKKYDGVTTQIIFTRNVILVDGVPHDARFPTNIKFPFLAERMENELIVFDICIDAVWSDRRACLEMLEDDLEKFSHPTLIIKMQTFTPIDKQDIGPAGYCSSNSDGLVYYLGPSKFTFKMKPVWTVDLDCREGTGYSSDDVPVMPVDKHLVGVHEFSVATRPATWLRERKNKHANLYYDALLCKIKS